MNEWGTLGSGSRCRTSVRRMAWTVALAVCLFLAAAPGRSWAGDAVWPVEVRLREAGGRVVEGFVRGHRLAVDQPTAFGGTDTAATPPEAFAFALGACVISMARLVALMERIEVAGLSAQVRGELDFTKALGRPGGGRAGYSGLEVVLAVDAVLSPAEKEAFLRKVAARCPLCDNVAEPTPLRLTLARP